MESVEDQDQDEGSESSDESDGEEEPELELVGDSESQETEAQIEVPEGTETSNSAEPQTPVPSTSEHIENPNDLKFDELQISDLSDRSLSRSPPRSQRQEDLASMSVHQNEIKAIVSSDLTKKRSQQQRKYHSKRSTRNAGRPTGSKAKQNKRVKFGEHSNSDVW